MLYRNIGYKQNSENFKQGIQMVPKFLGKVSRKSKKNCWISKQRTIKMKILEISGGTNGPVIPVRMFQNRSKPARLSSFPCEVVLLSGNSRKWYSIRHSKFPEIHTGTFMEWKVVQLIIFVLCLKPSYNLCWTECSSNPLNLV